MRWHEEGAFGDLVPAWGWGGDLEMPEQMQSLGWSIPMYWEQLCRQELQKCLVVNKLRGPTACKQHSAEVAVSPSGEPC